MSRLIRYFAERHLLVHVITAVVVVLGYRAAVKAPRETFPDVTLDVLVVQATLPGASARDVETKVTIPIEDKIEELDGVKEFMTVVTDSVSRTVIEFHSGLGREGLDEAERDLRSLLDSIDDFPEEMEEDPVIRRLESRRFPVVQIALSGPTESVTRAAKLLERRLRRLDQVSKVTLVGLQDPEVRVLVDPERARAHGVTLLDVVRAIEGRNVSSTGGELESPTDRRQVVLWSRFEDPREVGDTVLRFLPNGGALRVRDVARIESGREDTHLIAHTNGRPGISVVVTKRTTADILDTVDAVRALLAHTELPADVDYALVRDESFWTRNRLQLITSNGLAGAVLVAAALFAFLSPLVSFWVLAGVPVVFFAVLALFPVLGLSINLVTLTGFVVILGMIVDDAIVVGERIVSLRQEGAAPHDAAIGGAIEMARPVIASGVTTMLAFLPMWAIGGMAGKMLHYLPVVVVLALAASQLESFLILPAHMEMAGGRRPPPKRRFVLWLEERYRRLLRRVLRHRAWVVGSFALSFFVIMAVVAPRVPVLLFPQDDSEAVHIKITMPVGTPIERTEAVASSIERQIPAIMGDDLVAVLGRIGHQQVSQRGPELEPERGAAENEAIVSAMLRRDRKRHIAAEWIPILERSLQIPPDTRVVYVADILGPPMGLPVAVHVASNDDSIRRSAAQEVAEWLRSVGGVTNIEVDERPGTPEIDLQLDYDKLALHGLSAQNVGLTLRAAFHGLPASEHRDLDETTDFRVMLEPNARTSLDALLELPVRSRSGDLVRLRDVVRPVELAAVSRIYHREGRRAATVTAGFAPGSGHTALSMARRIERELLPRFAGIPDLDVTIGGEAKESRRTTGDIGTVSLLAVAGITVVIALMLGSFVEAFFVVAIIPFSLAAVVLTFYLHGQPLSLFAMMGTLGLAGVVVNSSIVMVDAIHRRLGDVSAAERRRRQDEVIEAVVTRLRPILVTSITTLGGVLPMAYGIGGYDAVVAPMSLALGWGLAASTLVTLVLVPALYTIAGDVRGMRMPVWRRRGPTGVVPAERPRPTGTDALRGLAREAEGPAGELR